MLFGSMSKSLLFRKNAFDDKVAQSDLFGMACRVSCRVALRCVALRWLFCPIACGRCKRSASFA